MVGQVPAGWVQWLPFIPGGADKPFVLPPHMIYSTGANTQSTRRGLSWSGNVGTLQGSAPSSPMRQMAPHCCALQAWGPSMHLSLEHIGSADGSYTENMFGSNSNKKIQRNLLLKACKAPSFPKRSTAGVIGDCPQGLWQSRGLSHIWHLGGVLPLL